MKYERKKLVADGHRIIAEDGEYIGTISMTQRAKDLIDSDMLRIKGESWLDFRKRTKQEREEEEKNRVSLVNDIVNAYNNSIDT